MLLDVRPDHLELVREILQRLVPDREVWAFGSRAKWIARDTSDLDLCIVGDTPLGFKRLGQLRDAFSESSLPYKVGVVAWATTGESFRKIIEREKVVVQKANPTSGVGGEWLSYEVSQLIEDGKLFIGDGYRAKNEELASSGLPFARAGNINDGFRFDDADHFPENNLARAGNKVSQPGDVVFTSKGTVGRFAFVRATTPRFVYSPQLCFWRSLDPKLIDPRFLFFWMFGREFFVQFKGVAGQTDMAEYVSLTDQRRMHITLPPPPDQRAIAHILGTLDDEIQMNRRMNETLETMARAIFKSWFVDFDPVRAKMESRDSSLPKPLADLFPARLVDSELGEIPEGWEVDVLENALELEVGGRPKGGVSGYTEGVPSIGAESIVGLGIFDYSKTKYIPREFFDRMTKGHVESRDVLLYKDGGRPGEFEPHVTLFGDGFPFKICAINEHVYRLRARTEIAQNFLFFWLSSDLLMAEMRIKGTGVAIPGLNSTQVRSLTALIPPRDVIRAFDGLVEPWITRLLASCNQSRVLAALRDTMLPKLISGELRVKDAEKVAGAVA